MGRRTEGRAVIADYSVWTVELSRDELMIILDGQKNHRINRAKRKLQFLRAQRDLHRGRSRPPGRLPPERQVHDPRMGKGRRFLDVQPTNKQGI